MIFVDIFDAFELFHLSFELMLQSIVPNDLHGYIGTGASPLVVGVTLCPRFFKNLTKLSLC